jgi:head-tail adaptor
MRHANVKIDILELVESYQRDDGSWSDEDWIPKLIDVPARIRWTTGREAIQFAQKQYLRDAVIRTDVIDVEVVDRVRYKGELFEIVDVTNPGEMDRFLKITVKRITDKEPD